MMEYGPTSAHAMEQAPGDQRSAIGRLTAESRLGYGA
jgi:hypothetical protein